jgi:hypothetical protein
MRLLVSLTVLGCLRGNCQMVRLCDSDVLVTFPIFVKIFDRVIIKKWFWFL